MVSRTLVAVPECKNGRRAQHSKSGAAGYVLKAQDQVSAEESFFRDGNHPDKNNGQPDAYRTLGCQKGRQLSRLRKTERVQPGFQQVSTQHDGEKKNKTHEQLAPPFCQVQPICSSASSELAEPVGHGEALP